MNYFQTLIYSRSFDIFAVTETWLDDRIQDKEILPTGYSIFRRDRNSHGGGILIAITEKIPSSVHYISNSAEILIVKLELVHTIFICCVYSPPSSPDSHYTEIINVLHQLPPDIQTIVVGDLNSPDIDWKLLTAHSSSHSLLCDAMFQLNLMQLITEPTHIHGNILDIVITNQPDKIFNIVVSKQNQSPSDHHPISFVIIAPKSRSHYTRCTKRLVYNYSQADLEGIQNHILNADIKLPLHSTNSSWIKLSTVIHLACNKHIPLKSTSQNSSPKWFTPEIKHQLNQIHSVKRKVKQNPTQHRQHKLDTLQSNLQQLMSTAKAHYESNLIASYFSQPNKLIQHLKGPTNKSIPLVITDESSAYSTPIDKAQAFNNYFHSVFTKSDYVLPHTDNLPQPTQQLHTIQISPNDVSEALNNLDPTKAPGHDNISAVILKSLSSTLTLPITTLFQQSIQSCSIPDDWKIHKIRPVPKCGDPSKVYNYRPISLLTSISKLLESIIYQKIIPFASLFISHNQYGFMKNRSCLKQLLETYSDIFNSIENGHFVDVIYLDFRKAFDTVPHDELLFKLWMIGITGPLWLWFKNYLSYRTHYVEVDGASSNHLPVLSGVPQGSILGPLLFLIYINDLPNSITSSSTYLFADDTKLIQSISKFSASHLQTDIDATLMWCQQWKLNLNISKCACIRFSLRRTSAPSYHMQNHELLPTSHHKDLGIITSYDLSWDAHYKDICSKAYCTLNLIKRSIAGDSSVHVRKALYICLVRSKISYCSQLWRPNLIKDIESIEKVQRRATKFILSSISSQYDILDYKQRLHLLQLLPLMYWYEIQDILFLVNCLKSPTDHHQILQHISFSTSTTRSAYGGKLMYNYRKYTKSRHFYYNRIVRLWNALPTIDLSLPLLSIKKIIYNIFWQHFTVNFDSANPCTYHFLCPCSKCHLLRF